MIKTTMYPIFTSTHIKNPNRFFAIPVIGIFVKIILLIPVGIELFALSVAYIIVSIINSCMVLFTGKYWETAYTLTLNIMKLGTKAYFYMTGLSNTYPGFDFVLKDGLSVTMPMPTKPNRLFAIPVVGGVIRIVMLIPYFIFEHVMQYASWIGIVVSFVPVLFTGKYPESTYELAHDYQRVNLSTAAFMSGLSDEYPSFSINMDHKNVKIALLILGALWALSSFFGNGNKSVNRNMYYYNNGSMQPANQQQYQQTTIPSSSQTAPATGY